MHNYDMLQNLGFSNWLDHSSIVMKAPNKMTSGSGVIRQNKNTEAYTRTNQSASPLTPNPNLQRPLITSHLGVRILSLSLPFSWLGAFPVNSFNFSTAKLCVQGLALLKSEWANPFRFGNIKPSRFECYHLYQLLHYRSQWKEIHSYFRCGSNPLPP